MCVGEARAIFKKIMNPCSKITIDGREYRINTQFYVWIEIENLMLRSEDENECLAKALALAFPVLPPDPRLAIEAIMWFIVGGEMPHLEDGEPGGVPCFDIKQDFAYIWGAFLGEFGIDLSKSDMHWWHFTALLKCLSENCKFSHIVGYRTMDLKNIKDREKRQIYAKMKKKFALKEIQKKEELGEQMIVDSLEGLF